MTEAFDDLFRVRKATPEDADAINGIYNFYVFHSTSTYQESAETHETRLRWLGERDETLHPVLVAERAGEIAGFGALSPFHRRSAYRRTAEDAVYVGPQWHRQGIGSALLAELIVRAGAAGHRSVVALIDSTQIPSIRLHARHGFKHVGTLDSAGYKFDRWLHVQYHQLLLDR